MKEGTLYIFSGPSGAGKSTVIHAMMKEDPDAFFSVSATTRGRRGKEEDGVDYLFVSKERFLDMIEKNALLEWAEYAGNYYGSPAGPVMERLKQGTDVYMDIETQGAAQVLEKYPNAVTIFVMAPSFEILEQRLRGRGDTGEADVEKRLRQGRRELERAGMYTYFLINHTEEQTIAAAKAIRLAERSKTKQVLSYYKGV